jgi:hypothetical protein
MMKRDDYNTQNETKECKENDCFYFGLLHNVYFPSNQYRCSYHLSGKTVKEAIK